MSEPASKKTIITYWLSKASEALAAASDDIVAGRYSFAVNRAYYACFYALSALLLQDDHNFIKHSGAKGAMHLHYVKTGLLAKELGRFYDRLFESRQRADYQELVVFEKEQAMELARGAEQFIEAMQGLLAN